MAQLPNGLESLAAHATVLLRGAVLRPAVSIPIGDRDKNTEILALRHQITVLEQQLGTDRIKFTPADRAFLAALLIPLPHQALRRLRLLARPDTVLRWHRNLTKRRHAPRSPRRFAFERTPSTCDGTNESSPRAAAMPLARTGSPPGRSCSTFRIR
ncbi:hypothetical protein [Streptomyces sp. NBC_01465]|uniref:hypothetical protein n=1 Tax=Streptomyces sp. NBC_01465 TaxID=2903878 RepID=UPI002E351498|nr:hypothetical protein [Streptomyces sp. NBC_01465]